MTGDLPDPENTGLTERDSRTLRCLLCVRTRGECPRTYRHIIGSGVFFFTAKNSRPHLCFRLLARSLDLVRCLGFGLDA